MSLNCAVALRTLSIRGEGAFFQDEESCMPSLESCKDWSPAEASKGAPSVNETSARQRRMLRGALLPRANGASSSRRSGFCRESFIVVYLAGLYWRPVRRSRGSGIRARDGDESVEAKSTFEGGRAPAQPCHCHESHESPCVNRKAFAIHDRREELACLVNGPRSTGVPRGEDHESHRTDRLAAR